VRANHKLAVALFAGVVFGGVAMHELSAQVRPAAYVIAEIEVTDREGFVKEYQPAVERANPELRPLARGGRTEIFKGEAPKRIILWAFKDIDQARAAFTHPAYTEALAIGSRYAKFRIFAVEGLTP
jgi:uncharacterized protein (DUF1330 family)